MDWIIETACTSMFDAFNSTQILLFPLAAAKTS